MIQSWKLFPDGYLEKIEKEAVNILNEAYEAVINPLSPDFIDGGALDKTRRITLNILIDLGLMRKVSDSNDAYVLTEKGNTALTEWKNIQAKIKRDKERDGKQEHLFNENGC